MKNGAWQMIFLRKVHKMKIILIIFAAIVLFVTVSFVRHKVCSSKEMDLLTPLGELVEVNGHNMSVYTEGTGDKTFVFMSGSGTCSPILDFKSLYSLLSNEYKIAVVEKFGYGFSDVVDKMERTGVAVVAKEKGLRCGITLRNLKIHDVHGNVYDKHMNNGGIYMTALQPAEEAMTGVARFSDILVEGCYVYRVSRWGIAVGYSYAHEKFAGAELDKKRFLKYGHENIVIRDNYVKMAGGDGITVMYALRPFVEHNMTDSVACEINDRIYCNPGNRGGKVAAAIWPWKCKDALFRYNEVADTRLNQDGMAYDADSGDGTVYEYNYSRQNEGGCVMFCMQEAIHNTFRNNVSYDDLGGTISPSENPDALLTDNIFYVRKGVPFVRKNMDGGNFTEENNQIIQL